MKTENIEAEIEAVRQQKNIQCRSCGRGTAQSAELVVQLTTPYDPAEAQTTIELAVSCRRCADGVNNWRDL